MAVSTVKSLSELAAVATRILSSGLISTAKGVANACVGISWAEGRGSRSMKLGFLAAFFWKSTWVIRLRKARF